MAPDLRVGAEDDIFDRGLGVGVRHVLGGENLAAGRQLAPRVEATVGEFIQEVAYQNSGGPLDLVRVPSYSRRSATKSAIEEWLQLARLAPAAT